MPCFVKCSFFIWAYVQANRVFNSLTVILTLLTLPKYLTFSLSNHALCFSSNKIQCFKSNHSMSCSFRMYLCPMYYDRETGRCYLLDAIFNVDCDYEDACLTVITVNALVQC